MLNFSPSDSIEKTLVLHDSESITKGLLGFYAKAKDLDMTVVELRLNIPPAQNIRQSMIHYQTSEIKVSD